MQGGSELPPDVIEQLEAIARRLNMVEGAWTLEVVFDQGLFRRSHRHHGPLKAEELRELAAVKGLA